MNRRNFVVRGVSLSLLSDQESSISGGVEPGINTTSNLKSNSVTVSKLGMLQIQGPSQYYLKYSDIAYI
jgi:hypothetical protein